MMSVIANTTHRPAWAQRRSVTVIVRGVGRAIAGLALVAAVSACDDNPLAEDRESGEYFRLSSSNAVVNVGDTITVVANVLNKFGAALIVNVTAAECDASVSVQPDTARSEFEAPEQFRIAGNSVGESCVVVNGGGVTDTIDVRVVPAAVDIALAAPGDTLLESGDVVNLPIAFLGATGAAAPGVSLDERTTFTVLTSGIGVIDAQGNFTARAPGTTWVRATFTDLGVSRRDSVQIRVVAAPFTGTAAQAAYGGGQVIEFTAGGIPFDANTRVEFPGRTGGTFVHLLPRTTMRAAIPPGTPAGTVITFNILNAGPTEATVAGTFTTTTAAPAVDPFTNNTRAEARPMAIGEDMFGTIAGVRGAQEWFQVTVTEAGTYRITFNWADALDKDAYVTDAAGAALLALESGAATNPETGTLDLQPGTYYLRGETWTPTAGAAAFYRMRFVKE